MIWLRWKFWLGILAAVLLTWLAIGEFLHTYRKRGAYTALCRLCEENTRTLGSMFREYTARNGRAPQSLDVLAAGSRLPWVFHCALVDTVPAEALLSPATAKPAPRITYRLLSHGEIRIVCSAWHDGLVAVDASGEVRKITKLQWMSIRNTPVHGDSLASAY